MREVAVFSKGDAKLYHFEALWGLLKMMEELVTNKKMSNPFGLPIIVSGRENEKKCLWLFIF